MTDEDEEVCGHPTADGSPCQNPPTDGDSCHLNEHGGDGDPSGRPTKLEEHRDDIMSAAREGMSLQGCARVAGIAEKTLHNWINDYDEFASDLRQARAEGELQHIRNVDDKGSQFLLERSFGYTKTEKHEVDLDADVDNTHDVTADFVTFEPESEDDGDS